MNINEKFWTRRKFLKTGSLTVFQFLLGSPPLSQLTEGKPKHHITEGFRNYPPSPNPPSYGRLSFFLRRFWGSLFQPEIPPDHILAEENAIIQFYALKNKNTLTWLGHSTYLIKLDGKTILIDPF